MGRGAGYQALVSSLEWEVVMPGRVWCPAGDCPGLILPLV